MADSFKCKFKKFPSFPLVIKRSHGHMQGRVGSGLPGSPRSRGESGLRRAQVPTSSTYLPGTRIAPGALSSRAAVHTLHPIGPPRYCTVPGYLPWKAPMAALLHVIICTFPFPFPRYFQPFTALAPLRCTSLRYLISTVVTLVGRHQSVPPFPCYSSCLAAIFFPTKIQSCPIEQRLRLPSS